MHDTLHKKPPPASGTRFLEFEEPRPNRMPFHFLLLIVSLPIAIISGFFILLGKLFGAR